ncbi:MAG: hypothetical protein ACLPY5_11755 [Candidatus Bathyarchaeia archaeon]
MASEMATSPPLADIVKETERIIDLADKKNVILRLFGGLAFRFHCPSATHRSLERKYADIDFMGLSKQARDIKKLFLELGYVPREVFNAYYGDQRLIFNDLTNERRIDIFLDVFKMCHKFDFKNRLLLNKPTIPLADLLATKLQVVHITEREYRDIIALVHDHEIGDSDGAETINGLRLAQLCSEDWGIYKTFSINLEYVLKALKEFQLDSEYESVARKHLEELTSRIENIPKTTGWKIRARIGEKKRWYELPEDDKKVIVSPTQLAEQLQAEKENSVQ